MDEVNNSLTIPIEDVEMHWTEKGIDMAKVCHNISTELAEGSMAAIDEAIEVLRLVAKWVDEDRLDLRGVGVPQHEDKLDDFDLGLPDSRIELKKRVREAINAAWTSAQVDGSHHRLWTINEMMRRLVGEAKHRELVKLYEEKEANGDEYEWDEGIAP